MKKGLFFLGLLSLLQSILSGCDNKEPVLIIEEFMDFRVIDYEPAWSPDGQWIAFYHGEPGKSGIYLISPDGKNIRKWHDGIPGTPAWSPDGQWIAFSEGAQIWKKKVDGDSLTQLTFKGRNFDPTWYIKGIAYRRSYSWPEDRDIQGIWLSYNNEYIRQIFSGNCSQVTWMDAENIIFLKGEIDAKGAFVGSLLCKKNIENQAYDVLNFLVNMDNKYPKYTSIYKRVAFTSKPRDKPDFRIWTMNADGSHLKQLTDVQSYTCDWSPDGKHIVYTDARNENGRLWIMDADGKNKRQLTLEHHFINF